TWNEGDARLDRAAEQLRGVELFREVEPEEVAALGAVPTSLPDELAVERLEHRVAPLTQQPGHALQARLEQPAPKELVHGRLCEQRRRDVRRGDEPFQLRRERLGDDRVADAQARRDRLRERRAVEDVLATLELEHARQPLALEADEAVRIVLENRQRPIAGKLREAPAPLVRERRPGRILEGRNRIEQRRRADAG